MKLTGDGIRLSATDLAHHLACRHLTRLDLAAAHGEIEPPRWRDPALEVLEQRGLRHERAYLDHLRASGLDVVDLRDAGEPAEAADRARAAMRAGAAVIAQATLALGRWFGRADVLLRVAAPSELGDWSYEVVDTKLSRETRGETILQLCLYSELVGAAQGALPRHMHVVPPGGGFERQTYRAQEFTAYYRCVRRRLEASADGAGAASYPEPASHCDICRWWPRCDAQRRADDHLCLVAGLSRLQMRELQSWPVTTLAALAGLPLPLERRARRGARESYERAREQARVQLEARRRAEPVHELLEREPLRGLARLPPPDPGDVFLDFEGNPFAGDGGLEYLLAWCDTTGEYHSRWAFDAAAERRAFEWLVDALAERCARFPGLHVYHFAPYEPAALRRLMGRHASREVEVDGLLRAERFVDLYAIVRQGLRAGVERYSIKDLEACYGFRRELSLRDVSRHLRALDRSLELDCVDELPSATRMAVLSYNRDDCRSARGLRDWLEGLRAGLEAAGETIARPVPKAATAPAGVGAREARTAPVKQALLDALPQEPALRTPAGHAQWLLAEMLEFHWREAKAPWWEYFRLRDLSDDELLDEKAAISGLAHQERIGGTDACPIDRYGYPPQDVQVRRRARLDTSGGTTIGTVHAIDADARTVDVKKRGVARDLHPGAVFAHSIVPTDEQQLALLRLGEWVAHHGIDGAGAHRAARDLLLAHAPRLRGGATLPAPGPGLLDAARRLALELDGGVLAIQGPPGTGKTYTGARMICTLVRAGRRVGVTALSHKVVRNLLDAVVAAAAEESLDVRCVQKVTDPTQRTHPRILEVQDNETARHALADGVAPVAGGTPWLWSRADFDGAVDVLFVDEAGQMSLADVLAVAPSARNLVLLGDPQQLEQPQQGSHPPGTAVSALQHLLGGAHTIAHERGLFLEETWRLHPRLCNFTSEVFYDGRLRARPALARQGLTGATRFAGAGLWYIPVEHEGNQSSAPEEADAVAALHAELTRDGVLWVDAAGAARPLTSEQVLIVVPYNAQVAEIVRRAPHARVGTVDKFQGQEAAVVIYGMTTSAPEDAPRGMEFLYSLNRLNVATSRARCACLLVASPRLFEPECRTPQQMRLANAHCRYLELAQTV